MPKKKSKADVGKLVDAQAKGKRVSRVRTDKKASDREELDVRVSKQRVYQVTPRG